MLPCRYCNGRTRVINTELHRDGQHRWLRCQICGQLTRSLEIYADGRLCSGPVPGAKRRRKQPPSTAAPRAATGERNANAVLTAADVQQLRQDAADGVSRLALLKRYGISSSNLSRIINRKAWAHVP